MPFASKAQSKAQRRKMRSLERAGEIKKGTSTRWEAETDGKELPERSPTPAAAKARRRKVERAVRDRVRRLAKRFG